MPPRDKQKGIIMSDVNLSISKEVVEPIVREKIQAAVVTALDGDPNNIIEAVVRAALDEKVDSDGRKSNYRNDHTYVEYLCHKAIREAAEVAVKSWMGDNAHLIREAVERDLSKRKGAIARSFVTGLADAIKQSWCFSVNVTLDTPSS